MQTIKNFIETQKIDKTKSNWRTSLPQFESVNYGADEVYHWTMETNVGTMKFKLLADVAPNHVTNTIYLTELGFYDNLSFHRVIDSFMAQGGCPLGTGTGGPGYKFAGEYSPKARHTKKGLLSMANAGPGTDGSQFFITFKETPWLDGKHTIFGEIIEGEDILATLEANGSQSGATTKDLKIVKATITKQ